MGCAMAEEDLGADADSGTEEGWEELLLSGVIHADTCVGDGGFGAVRHGNVSCIACRLENNGAVGDARGMRGWRR